VQAAGTDQKKGDCMRIAMIAAGSAFALAAASPAQAIINVPVPSANYITFGGADWAWASPCNPTGSGCGDGVSGRVDLTFQATEGWRLPTLAELLAGPSVSDFGTSTAFACASAYFSVGYTHCDYDDAASGEIYGLPGANSFAETWVVRGAVAAGVPEPGTWAMMILGFGLAGFFMRATRRPKVSYSAL
jgi:hypothetical protein